MLARIPEGAKVTFEEHGDGEAVFEFPGHPTRIISGAQMTDARPLVLEDWLKLGEEADDGAS